MVSVRENSTLRRMYLAVVKHGYIDMFELQLVAGRISISTYNKLKPYLLHKYKDVINYDKDKKVFYLINPEDPRLKGKIEEFLKL